MGHAATPNWIRWGAALGAAGCIGGGRAQAADWQVKDAPFRAELKVAQPATDPAFGIAVELPEFGFGRPDMTDISLITPAGKFVPLHRLWRGEGRMSLLLAKELPEDSLLYFGGQRNPSSANWQGQISLLMETRQLGAAAARGFDSTHDWERAWSSAADKIDGMQFVPGIEHAGNPFGAGAAFLTKFTGVLKASGGAVTFYTLSSDASFVEADGKSAFAWPGAHNGQANAKSLQSGSIDLTRPVALEYRHAKFAQGPAAMVLGWDKGGKQMPVPPAAWQHAGRADIVRIAEQRGRPVPDPQVKVHSYLGYGDAWLYDLEVSLAGGVPDDWQAAWTFGDGAVMMGKSARRILAAEESTVVSVALKKGAEGVKGTRRHLFEEPPPAASIQKPADVAHYLQLLDASDPSPLTESALRAVFPFLKDFGDDAIVGKYAGALNARLPDAADPLWLPSLSAWLRGLAQAQPARAMEVLKKLPNDARRRHEEALGLLEMELRLYHQRDARLEELVKAFSMSQRDAPAAKRAQIRLGDYCRLEGRFDEAIRHYRSVEAALIDPKETRKLPAQDQAYSLTLTDLINAGSRDAAEAKLAEWELAHPTAKLSTDYLLLRGRMLMLFGRWQAALMEFDSFSKINPDSPYQIELDFYAAHCRANLGQQTQAKAVWKALAAKFPNHPLADKCKQLASP
jgi:tetratricopeptide (TPR) repeat protein